MVSFALDNFISSNNCKCNILNDHLQLLICLLSTPQCVQVCYGFYMASEVAYYTYIYAKVDKDKYQLVTGHTRSAILAGRFISSVLAQLLYSYSLMNVRELNYISFGCESITTN